MGSASESKVKHLAMHSHGSAPPFYSECTVAPCPSRWQPSSKPCRSVCVVWRLLFELLLRGCEPLMRFSKSPHGGVVAIWLAAQLSQARFDSSTVHLIFRVVGKLLMARTSRSSYQGSDALDTGT